MDEYTANALINALRKVDEGPLHWLSDNIFQLGQKLDNFEQLVKRAEDVADRLETFLDKTATQ